MPDDIVAAIHARRSIGRVGADTVPQAVVRELLDAAVTAPNHHLTGPWRFIVLAGEARRTVGEAHACAVARENADLTPEGRNKEAARLERAPVVIACCVVPGEDATEAREDRDAVAAAVQNLLLAAHARGLGAMWRTGAMADEAEVRAELGIDGRGAIVGFVYLGWPLETPAARTSPRPGAEAFTDWRGW